MIEKEEVRLMKLVFYDDDIDLLKSVMVDLYQKLKEPGFKQQLFTPQQTDFIDRLIIDLANKE